MGDASSRRGRLPQELPPALLAEAASHPGGSLARIDPAYVTDPDGYVPAEAIMGYWRVGDDGILTGEFEENPRHGPPQDDFRQLTEPDHYLGWLGDRPAEAVREAIVDVLRQQVAEAVLDWIKVVDKPRFLTGGRPQPDDENRIILTRAGLALPFALSVTSPAREHTILEGVFSWVAVGLDRPGRRKDQVWFDLGMELDRAETELGTRIYQVGRASAAPLPAADAEGNGAADHSE